MSTSFSPLIDELINALRCLPGVGPKSAQRAAFHLLQRNRQGAFHLAKALDRGMQQIQNCQECRTLCEMDVCHFCSNQKRDRSLLCIVESPADILAIEQTGHYRGMYFVLMGHLSPLDGIGPEELGLDKLNMRLAENEIKEIILATSATVEGQITAHYISQLAEELNIETSRLAQGISIGGELEYTDSSTLAHALRERRKVQRAENR
jgi:recombination protein RecR